VNVASAQTEEGLRARVREIVAAFRPKDRAGPEMLGALFDAGLAWVWFPIGMGGLGIEARRQATVAEEVKALGGSLRRAYFNPVGTGMAAPVLVSFGRADQCQRWLRPLFTGDEIWCQLFSEPAAGSDLAAVTTRAARESDGWRITGQKVWSTLAHEARWGILLARTDAAAARHEGLTFFVIDMHQPGVDVRPLRQLTGDAEFNEVFLDGAWVPDDQRVGAVGDGWRVALGTLMNERQAIANVSSTPPQIMQRAIDLYRRSRAELGPVALDQLIRLWIADRFIRLTNARASHLRASGAPGPEGSVGKLARTTINQDILEFCVTLMGAEGMLYPAHGYDLDVRSSDRDTMSDLRWQFLRSRAGTIEGGTSEIQRTVLGERVLGLPREPRVDRAHAAQNGAT
jgi:alkylation response protein AidB-like acyl-CoA dehydrogenase